MAITSIRRDWGVNPSIVRIETTNTLSEVSVSGYLVTQAEIIRQLNYGVFDFLSGDLIAVSASNGDGIFEFLDGDLTTLVNIVPSLVGGLNQLAYFDSTTTLSSDPLLIRTGNGLQIGTTTNVANPNILFYAKEDKGAINYYAADSITNHVLTVTNKPLNGFDVELLYSNAPGVLTSSGGAGLANNTPKIRAYLSANQSIPNGTSTQVVFNQTSYDTHGMLQPGGSIVIDGAGYYTISVNFAVQLVAMDSGVTLSAKIIVNGASFASISAAVGAFIPVPTHVSYTDRLLLADNDVVTLEVYQNAGAARDMIGATQYTFITMSRDV